MGQCPTKLHGTVDNVAKRLSAYVRVSEANSSPPERLTLASKKRVKRREFTREDVWAEIWGSRRYQSIQALKDKLNRQVSIYSSYALAPSSSPSYTQKMKDKTASLEVRLKRTFKALNDFESKVFAKHGMRS